MIYDVFNGDADGLCTLQQLRLARPAAAELVTGVKRDIALLERVEAAAGDEIWVMDVSLDKNRQALLDCLERGAKVHYFDHHYAGEIPQHPALATHINLASDTCSSLIMDRYLEGRHTAWAVVGAFGDNFDDSARQAAAGLGLSDEQLLILKRLGICLNYNGYGATVADLYFDPAQLARRMRPYADPLAFIEGEAEVYETLTGGADADLAAAEQTAPETMTERLGVYIFPAEPWARRVSGVFSNKLATAAPDRAHALLTHLPQGGYLVSVRAPLNNKSGADELCRSFHSGGGRKAAAGINQLPDEMLGQFMDAFKAMYG